MIIEVITLFFLLLSSFFVEVITLPFFFLSSFFNYSFPSSPKLSRMNVFLFLSISLELRLVNFDFLFAGDFTLLELVFSFCQFIANFAFCFSSSGRTDCRIIDSAVSEISSEVELIPAVPFNEFGGATRKLFFYKLIYREHWYPLSYTAVSVALKFQYH